MLKWDRRARAFASTLERAAQSAASAELNVSVDVQPRRALVLTISDGVAAGTRDDASGDALAARLAALGFEVERRIVPDEMEEIAFAVTNAARNTQLIVSTGGTGLGPRDRTPQTLHALLDFEIQGFGEQMRAYGRTKTPMADLSRSLGGVLGSTLVIAVPGSVSGATESLQAVEPLLDHALETLRGHTQHEPTSQD